MKKLANGLFQSKLLYGAELWGVAPKYLKRKIQSLQLDVVRLILGPTSYRRSTKYLLEQMKWLPLEKLLQMSSAKLTHQIINDKVPQALHTRMTSHITKPHHTRISGPNRLGSRPQTYWKDQILKATLPS